MQTRAGPPRRTFGRPSSMAHVNGVSIAGMGLLSLLFGCDKGSYEKRDGAWYFEGRPVPVAAGEALTPIGERFARAGDRVFYRATPIEDADGRTFEALGEHYAKDAAHVWYCDTYRDGREYFMRKHDRVQVIARADPRTFRYIDRGYARDSASVFFEGVRFAVEDVGSFELLEHPFARDRVAGYYMRERIPGGDGATFVGVDSHYSKDRANVFYSDVEPGVNGGAPMAVHVRLPGAQPASFVAMDADYAADAGQAYFKGRVLTRDVAAFQVLAYGYAKSATEVFFEGEPVADADAATFSTFDSPTDESRAGDALATYAGAVRTIRSSAGRARE